MTDAEPKEGPPMTEKATVEQVSDVELFRRVITTASKNGFDFFRFFDVCSAHFELKEWGVVEGKRLSIWAEFRFKTNREMKEYREAELNTLLFYPAFARALWGEELVKTKRGVVAWEGQLKPDDVNGPAEYDRQYEEELQPAWQNHVKKLAVRDNPLDWVRTVMT